jgi:uncharacterized membrane protein
MKENDGYNSNKENEEREETLEVVISYVLVAGIILSFVIITYVLLSYYIAPSTRTPSHLSPNWQIRTGTDFFTYFAGLFSYFTTTSFPSAEPVRIIGLGTVLLILRPFIRVIASAIFFGYRRNFKYLLITSFVLIVLVFSLTMHR